MHLFYVSTSVHVFLRSRRFFAAWIVLFWLGLPQCSFSASPAWKGYPFTNFLVPISYTVQPDQLPVLQFGARRIYIDVDADGDLDVLYQNGSTSGVGISLKINTGNGSLGTTYDANGTGTFSSGPFNGIAFTQISTTGMFTVDYDNDGDIDLVEPANTVAGRIIRNDGNGIFTVQPDQLPVLQFGARRIYIDVDADGDLDVLYQSGNTSGVGISLKINTGNGSLGTTYDANGTGTFSSGPFNGITFTQITKSGIFPVDYDNDGDIDLVEPANTVAGRIIRKDGNGIFTVQPDQLPVLQFGARRIYIDVDADGDLDVLYQSGNTSGVGISLKINTGNGSLGTTYDANGTGTFTSGPFNGITFTQITTTGIFPVDYDNDGDTDLVEPANTVAGRIIRQESAPPALSSTAPADNATGVSPTTSLTLTFNRTVAKGAGNLLLVAASNNTIVETIPVTSTQVTGSGATWIVDPNTTLAYSTAYYVKAAKATFADADGRIFLGINTNTAFNFTTAAPPPVPTISGLAANSATVCVGRPVTFTATVGNITGNYSYTLSNGSSTSLGTSSSTVFSQSVTAVGSGTQTFTLTVNSAGQVASTTAALTVNSLPTVGLTSNGPLTCSQTSVTLTTSVSGGVAPINYRFSGGAAQIGATAQATTSQAGLYSVTVTSAGGCSVTAATNVVSNTALTVTAGASLAMANVGVTVSLTASGGSNYVWSAPAGTQFTSSASSSAVSASLVTAGVKNFTVVASTGACSQSAVVSVTALVGPDLTATVNMPQNNFTAGASLDLVVAVQEVNGSSASGTIVVTVTVPTGFSVSFSNSPTSVTPSGGSAVTVQNSRWHQISGVQGQQVSISLNTGESVGASTTQNIGFKVVRTTANAGSTSNITVNVADDSSGSYDVNRLNNVYARIITGS